MTVGGTVWARAGGRRAHPTSQPPARSASLQHLPTSQTRLRSAKAQQQRHRDTDWQWHAKGVATLPCMCVFRFMSLLHLSMIL